MTTIADPGDRVVLTAEWTAEGVPAPTVTFPLRKPDGTTENLTVTVGTVGQVVTATVTYDVPRANSAADWYHGDFVCVGNPVAVEPVAFYVRRSAVLA